MHSRVVSGGYFRKQCFQAGFALHLLGVPNIRKVAKSGFPETKSGKKWQKMAKTEAKSGEKWHKWQKVKRKVAKIDKKWQKVAKNGKN